MSPITTRPRPRVRPRRAWLALAALAVAGFGSARAAQPLVVCADPNDLPFSNRAGQGFENELAQMLAHAMHTQVQYVWWAQRRGYVRSTLNESKCQLWPGIAIGTETVATTRPYYRSTYEFVTRADRHLSGLSLDDARLRNLSIGVQMIGNNATNTPPAHALARRGITENVHGYMLFGQYDRPDPAATIVRAVERGDIDVALVWGPLAGYFASRSRVPLQLEPITPSSDGPQLPMVYEIGVGVRRGDTALRERVDQILEREQTQIAQLLRRYHVPQVPDEAAVTASRTR